MALTQLEEFRDIMYTDNFVDLPRLKNCALHGVPPEIRAEVWKYLLDVSKLDKSEEVSLSKKLVDKYEEMAEASQNDMEILRKVKAQLRNFKSPLWEAALDAKGRKMMERVAVCYLAQNSDVPSDNALSIVYFLPPFVYCVPEESDAYYCFQGLMHRVSALLPHREMRLRMARFMMLFKTLFPEINAALEEEEVEPNEWAVSWLHFLLCRELPVECGMRLWDAYLAANSDEDGLLLHPYVCLAILDHLQGTLIELGERAEILAALQCLPNLDMDQIMTQAQSLRDEVRARNLL